MPLQGMGVGAHPSDSDIAWGGGSSRNRMRRLTWLVLLSYPEKLLFRGR
jgi:hypothetical protein